MHLVVVRLLPFVVVKVVSNQRSSGVAFARPAVKLCIRAKL